MKDRLVGISETSAIIGCSKSKTLRLAKSHSLPFRKLGKTWVIPLSTLYRELGLEQPDDDKEADFA